VKARGSESLRDSSERSDIGVFDDGGSVRLRTWPTWQRWEIWASWQYGGQTRLAGGKVCDMEDRGVPVRLNASWQAAPEALPQMSDVRCQMSDVRCQKSEVRSETPEVRSETPGG
jgi:hypothetical protein